MSLTLLLLFSVILSILIEEQGIEKEKKRGKQGDTKVSRKPVEN